MRFSQNDIQLEVTEARIRNLERAATLIPLLDRLDIEVEEINILDDDSTVELDLLTEYADLSGNTEEAIQELITLLKGRAAGAILANTTFRSTGWLHGMKATIR